MKKILSIAVLLMSLSAMHGRTLKVESQPEHNWWWEKTETPALTFTASDLDSESGPAVLKISVRGDREDSPTYFTQNISLNLEENNPTSVTINPTLPGAGFYRVSVSDGNAELTAFNIGISPEEVVSRPDSLPGLKAFWDKALAELATVPMNATIVELPEKSSNKRKIYFCQYLSLDNDTVSGYLAMPVKEGRYPAIIYYNGYNGTPWDIDPDGMPEWIEFQHWVRGQGPNKPYNRYGDYIQWNLDDPSNYYYRGAFMDAIRTIDFIASLPQTDTDNIFAEGGSQGGAFTFVAAALDPSQRLRAIAPYIPFLSDYPDYFEIVSWPGDVVKTKAKEIGLDDATLYRNLSYFDIKNLTPWIKVPVLMGVGLQDPTCPPHTNFAGYNNLNVEREFVIYPLAGHTVDYSDWNPRRERFFKNNMKTNHSTK